MSPQSATQPLSPHALRRIILDQSQRAKVGHIGSALSVVDVLVALYGHILHIPSPESETRDRFILSKGHAALALYGTFFLKGWLTQAELDTYCGRDSLLGVHPEHFLRGVDFSTGSLGQGLCLGAGAALAARMKKAEYRTVVLMSDAECNEGSVWEAAMFAAHHGLSNLVAVIDQNGQQAFGYTRDVLDLEPLSRRWEAFGWDVQETDGHDVGQMRAVFERLSGESGRPHLVIARTVFGKGVSFMENQIKWHYWPMSDDEYRRALRDIEAGPRGVA